MNIPIRSRSYNSFNSVNELKRTDDLIGCIEELVQRVIVLEAKVEACKDCPAKAPAKKASSK